MNNIVGITQEISNQVRTQTVGDGTMDKDDFLQLLVMQLQNQDPFEPVDNQQMAAQLAQFTSLETLNNMHETMQNDLLLNQSLNNSFMTSMIGKEIKAYGNGVEFDGSAQELSYFVNGNAQVTVEVYNSEGDLIRTIEEGSKSYGDHETVWDGRDKFGNLVEEGDYTFVATAVDSQGESVQTSTYVTGLVSGITYQQGSPYLLVNGQMVNLGEVISILEADSGGTGSGQTDNNNGKTS